MVWKSGLGSERGLRGQNEATEQNATNKRAIRAFQTCATSLFTQIFNHLPHLPAIFPIQQPSKGNTKTIGQKVHPLC